MRASSGTGMLDWTMRLTESEEVRRKMLVDNPADLYGF
jgi:D-galactarolactone isomerase